MVEWCERSSLDAGVKPRFLACRLGRTPFGGKYRPGRCILGIGVQFDHSPLRAGRDSHSVVWAAMMELLAGSHVFFLRSHVRLQC